jgi:hypothetical protein
MDDLDSVFKSLRHHYGLVFVLMMVGLVKEYLACPTGAKN